MLTQRAASTSSTASSTIKAEERHVLPTDEDDIMQLAIAMSLEGSAVEEPEAEADRFRDRFRDLRLALMIRLTDELPELKKKGGLKSIHFLQVPACLLSIHSIYHSIQLIIIIILIKSIIIILIQSIIIIILFGG